MELMQPMGKMEKMVLQGALEEKEEMVVMEDNLALFMLVELR